MKIKLITNLALLSILIVAIIAGKAGFGLVLGFVLACINTSRSGNREEKADLRIEELNDFIYSSPGG